jgi:hypothetical protein
MSATNPSEAPLTTITVEGRTFNVYTLPSYSTPYFYVRELGSREHRMTIRQLMGVVRRAIKAGNL